MHIKSMLVVVWLSLTSISMLNASSEGEASKERLLKEIDSAWAGTERLLIQCEITSLVAPPSTTPYSLQMTVALGKHGEFYSSIHHFTDGYPAQIDPFAEEILVSDGKVIRRWPTTRIYRESPIRDGDYYPEGIWNNSVLRILPFWRHERYVMPDDPTSGIPVVLADALKSTAFRVYSTSEFIASRNCSVFAFGDTDKAWVDSERKCLLKFERRSPNTDEVMLRIVVDEVSELAPGRWLPKTYRIQTYEISPTDGKYQLQQENRIDVLRTLLNSDVPTSTFALPLLPGTVRLTTNGAEQVVPGGREILDEVHVLLTRYVGLQPKQFGGIYRIASPAIGFGLGACVAFLALGMLRGRRAEN